MTSKHTRETTQAENRWSTCANEATTSTNPLGGEFEPRPSHANQVTPREDTFAINVMGTIHLTRLLVPSMIDRGGGNIVVVSSASGKVPSPAQTIYSASKHAVNGYFHSLRAELAEKNIKITVACPGPIETSPSLGHQSSSGNTKLLSEKRMPVSRCAELIIIAATHGLKEAWISYHPILFLMYVMQYLPSVGYAIIDKVGPKRVSSEGQQAYSAKLLFGQKKKST